MQFPETVVATVRRLNQQKVVVDAAAQSAAGCEAEYREAAKRQWEAMGFRERYLGGWFGGDKQLIQDRENALEQAVQKAREATQQRQWAEQLLKLIMKTLHRALLADNLYKDISRIIDRGEKILIVVDEFLRRVEWALQEIREAQSANALDAVIDNPGMSVMDYIETDEARHAVQRVKQIVEDFKTAVQDYAKTTICTDNLEPDSTLQTLDIVIDLAGFDIGDFDFGFLDWLQTEELARAEGSMESILREARRIKSVIQGRHQKAVDSRDSSQEAARQQCLGVL